MKEFFERISQELTASGKPGEKFITCADIGEIAAALAA
jgi:hypothetical protein